MEHNIIARDYEKKLLSDIYSSRKPEFLALYGRRRVGKTFLINEYFEGKGLYFEIIGTKDTSREVQIARFSIELKNKFYNGKKELDDADNWDLAMCQLITGIDEKIKVNPNEKIILFFDELPWLDSRKSGFLGALSYLWNKYLCKSKYANILLIVCGSAASWMIRNVINDKGGLYNRLTKSLKLSPFSLGETELFLKSLGVNLEKKQIIELYFALGGIPKYLSNVEKGMSSSQIINNLCFSTHSYLCHEFDQLFSSLFEHHHNHLKIIKTLATSRKAMTRAKLLKTAKLGTGGEMSTYLKELEEAGFIMTTPEWGKIKKDRKYKLIDEYSLFYLKWIEPSQKMNIFHPQQNLWTQKRQTASWHSWAGYAFEALCFKHIENIKRALGISGIITHECGWHYAPPKDNGEQGAQVDLVIERADKTINLCEIKYAPAIFTISKSYKKELEYKKATFIKQTQTKCQVFMTLISTYGTIENNNYIGTIDNQLTMKVLFE